MIAAVSAVAANWYAKHREGTSISQPSFWHAIVAVRTQHQIVNQLCCWHKIITIHRGCTERHSGTIFCSAHATLLVQKHHNQGKERHCQHFDPHFCYFGYFCGCFTLYAAEISNPAPTREPACFLSATYMTMIDKLLESILRLFFLLQSLISEAVDFRLRKTSHLKAASKAFTACLNNHSSFRRSVWYCMERLEIRNVIRARRLQMPRSRHSWCSTQPGQEVGGAVVFSFLILFLLDFTIIYNWGDWVASIESDWEPHVFRAESNIERLQTDQG